MKKGFYIHNRRGRRAASRMMLRDEQGHAGGGTNPENPGGAGESSESGQNNAGLGFDETTFWQSPSSAGSDAPSGGSAADGATGGGSDSGSNEGLEYGRQFAEKLTKLSFAPVFNADIATQIGEGNLDGVNQAISQLGRDSVQQSVLLSTEIMQAYGKHLIGQVEAMIQQSFGSRDNDSALMAEFPQVASNPAMKPMVEGIFNQAMKHSKNDRAKAIAMTRDMLKFTATGISGELGLNNAPGGSGDRMDSSAKSLVDELLGR